MMKSKIKNLLTKRRNYSLWGKKRKKPHKEGNKKKKIKLKRFSKDTNWGTKL